MHKAGILASHGDLKTGAASSIGIGSALLSLAAGNITFPTAGRNDVPRELRIVADGDVKFRGLDGEWDTWTDQVAGDVIPIAVQEIASTANGSTATVRVIY